MKDEDIFEAVGHVAKSIQSIAHGDIHAPGGLEALAMFTKEGHQLQADSNGYVADAIKTGSEDIAESLNNVAEAIQSLASAIGEKK